MSEILRNGYGAGKIMLNGVAYGKIVGSSGADISEIDDFYGIKHYGPIPVSTNIDEENLTMKVLTIDHYDSAADQYAEIKTKMATAGFNSDTVDYTNGIDLYLDNGDTGKHFILNILDDTANSNFDFSIKFKSDVDGNYYETLNTSNIKIINKTNQYLPNTSGLKVVYQELGTKGDGIAIKFLLPSEANTAACGIAYITPESENDSHIIVGYSNYTWWSKIWDTSQIFANNYKITYGGSNQNQMSSFAGSTLSSDTIQITRLMTGNDLYANNFFLANEFPSDIKALAGLSIRRFYIDNEPYGVIGTTANMNLCRPVVKLPK